MFTDLRQVKRIEARSPSPEISSLRTSQKRRLRNHAISGANVLIPPQACFLHRHKRAGNEVFPELGDRSKEAPQRRREAALQASRSDRFEMDQGDYAAFVPGTVFGAATTSAPLADLPLGGSTITRAAPRWRRRPAVSMDGERRGCGSEGRGFRPGHCATGHRPPTP
jgi:hypothetical protein